MPLYSYVCPSCGWTNEVFRQAEQRDAARPRCGFCYSLNYDVPMRRELSKVSVHGETVARP
jgi:putative FmdB family regulatory protein